MNISFDLLVVVFRIFILSYLIFVSSRAGIETVVEQMVVQSQAQIKEPMIGEVVNRFFVEKLPQLEQEFRKLVWYHFLLFYGF